jgi:hypothetical protein
MLGRSFEDVWYVSPVKLGVALTVLAGSETAAIHTETHTIIKPHLHLSTPPLGFDLLDCHSSM